MTKLITTTAIALMLASPAFAQTDTDPGTASINDDNRARMNTDDLRMERADGEFFIFRDRSGRRFRMPRSFFMDDEGDTDPGTASINDENRDRMNTNATGN